MIVKFYEVRCDYCDRTINHYPRVKPSLDILRRDGIICTQTKTFCSQQCYDDWNHNRQEKQYMNLRQNGKIHNETL